MHEHYIDIEQLPIISKKNPLARKIIMDYDDDDVYQCIKLINC